MRMRSLSITDTEKVTEKKTKDKINQTESQLEQPVTLTVKVPDDLYRAYQRCCWIINHETGRPREELAREMVTDFLVKYGC